MHDTHEKVSFTLTASRSPLFICLHPLHIHIYLDRFTAPTISQSLPSARILILAAEGVSARNVALVHVIFSDNIKNQISKRLLIER